MDFSFTPYFKHKVLVKRPYITREMCIRVVQEPLRTVTQIDGDRVRFWHRFQNWVAAYSGS